MVGRLCIYRDVGSTYYLVFFFLLSFRELEWRHLYFGETLMVEPNIKVFKLSAIKFKNWSKCRTEQLWKNI